MDDLAGWPTEKFRCIVADPPWPQPMSGQYRQSRKKRPLALPYATMTIEEISALPIDDIAELDAHLWLWTTNFFLEMGFSVMRAWGFKYLAPVHWVKPSGIGNYFVHRTQTILFGYKEKCRFPGRRYAPNVFYTGTPKRHSEKPEESFELIESVSPGPRLELFARRERPGWTVWGNEISGRVIRQQPLFGDHHAKSQPSA